MNEELAVTANPTFERDCREAVRISPLNRIGDGARYFDFFHQLFSRKPGSVPYFFSKKMNDIDYELILETNSPGDCAFIKSILDAEGISYLIHGEHVAPYIYYSVPMRLLVKKIDAPKARDILRDLQVSSAYGGLKRLYEDANKEKGDM